MPSTDAELATDGAVPVTPIAEPPGAIGTVFVEERVLRRVIKEHRHLRGVGLLVPHEHTYHLPKADLANHVEADELPDLANLPDKVIVIAADREKLTTPEAWTAVWRNIFHAHVHLAFEAKLDARRLTLSAIRERINRIGQTEFDEIRSVLKQEDLLLPPVDDISTYVEFVALYLELSRFAPSAIERTFPAVFDTKRVDQTIELDIDPTALLAASRPTEAPAEPVIVAHVQAEEREAPVVLSESAKRSARAGALSAREKGNRSRAAILHYRSGNDVGGEADVGELVARLSRALTLKLEPDAKQRRSEQLPIVDPEMLKRWTDALCPVAEYAARASSLRFSVAARLLHDLQTACVVAEREVKVVDVATWALSFGKRPVIRELPATREVRIAKHVKMAVAKIPACGVPSDELSEALREMQARADGNVRAVMRPKIETALDQVDLHPHSLPERVGEKKLVDELLDRAVDVGRLTIGNLRDSVSKNDLKVNDLQLRELKTGDQLLRADDLLSKSMDGVYRRGEQYMRFLQKLSSLLFGTMIGRFLTLWFLLPALGSLAVMEGLQHTVGLLIHKITHQEPEIAGANVPPSMQKVICFAFLFLLIHVKPFRRVVSWAGLQLWSLLRLLLWRIPIAIWTHPVTSRYLQSPIHRWLVRPALLGGMVWLVIPSRFEIPVVEELRHVVAAGVVLLAMLILNTRFWRMTQERIGDAAVRSGRHVTTRLIPGAIKLILELFSELIERMDRGIYRVDEFFRFRTGQSRAVVIVKGALGAVWFLITYILRLYINLFVEPTINPIKHFPVVTVAAKLIIPILPSLKAGIGSATEPLFGAFAGTFAVFTVLVLPGLAGFLVWEFKENWRLYRTTRPKTLTAQAIGHHGESMIAFLKPGFHSGTIPKLYTKLRRSAWKDDERGVAKQREGLHHVEQAIQTFVDRQLVSMLNEVPSFTATDVAVSHVEIGSNRVQIELVCPSVGREHARIRFEQQSGWLVASIPEVGWIAQLDEHHRRIFEIALTGFYKLSGVELAREQLEHALRGDGTTPPPYDISDEGLLVWPAGAYDTEAMYDLHASRLRPSVRAPNGKRLPFDGDLPDLGAKHALFGREPLRWSVWSTAWQQIARGEPPMPLLVGPSLLANVRLGNAYR